ncbi:hypothetical protein AAE478_009974 [Parahypoxylon ruwenzoriense]
MAPYDSDSSAGEEDDYTETNVLLGYTSRDPNDENVSRLGGRPEWLDASAPPSAALARCKICKDLMVLLLQLDGELPERFPSHERRLYVFSCRRKTCRRKEGSIRSLRSVRVAPGSSATESNTGKAEKTKLKEEKPKPLSNLGEKLFGAKTIGSSFGSANPFSTSTSTTAGRDPSCSGGNPFSSGGNPFINTVSPPAAESKPELKPRTGVTPSATTDEIKALPKTFAETLSLNNDQAAAPPTPPEPWPTDAEQPAPYPVSYLSDAEFETLDPTPPPAVPASARIDLDGDNTTGGSSGKEDREVFESSMDATFQRFADRLAQNPEQVVRYEFGGQPLLYSKTDAVGRLLSPPSSLLHNGSIAVVTSTSDGDGGAETRLPRCLHCGAPRTFEVQLTPHAIAELEAEEPLSAALEDGMDWGTIIVGVCARDCVPRGVPEASVGYAEEWAGVQWEELASAAPTAGGKEGKGGKGRR